MTAFRQGTRVKKTVYIETTIPSFLTSRPSGDLIVAGKQLITHDWWEQRRKRYRLFISQYVIDEASRGDQNAAEKRLAIIESIPLLEIDQEVAKLTEVILSAGLIPEKAATDAAHIAVVCRHGVDFMITWNCTHIANAEILAPLEDIVVRAGYRMPIICTPDELFGGEE